MFKKLDSDGSNVVRRISFEKENLKPLNLNVNLVPINGI